MAEGKLFVISGASGVGKSTVLAQVMAARQDLRFSVSATTRAPRAGEVDGQSYYFVTKDKFREMIEKNEFLEYDAHMDNYYGTPKNQLEEKLQRGSVILDIEPNGAFNVRREKADAVLIFIAPPSLEELELLTLGGLRRAVKEGDIETGSVMTGQVAGMLQKIRPLREIFEDLCAGRNAVLKETQERWS